MHFAPDVLRDRASGPEKRDRLEVGLLKRAVDQNPQSAGRHAVACGMNRRDAVEVDRAFGVLLDDLEFRVFHDDLIASDSWFSEDDDLLVAGNHLLHPRHVEPPADQRRAQHARGLVLDPGLENPPRPEPPVNGFSHDAEKADGSFGSLVGEAVEFDAVFVSSGEMFQQVAQCLESEPAQRRHPLSWHPVQFLKPRCGGKPAHAALRTPTIRICASVRPCQQFQSRV